MWFTFSVDCFYRCLGIKGEVSFQLVWFPTLHSSPLFEMDCFFFVFFVFCVKIIFQAEKNGCKPQKKRKKEKKNIQQLTFAGRHRPNYYSTGTRFDFG